MMYSLFHSCSVVLMYSLFHSCSVGMMYSFFHSCSVFMMYEVHPKSNWKMWIKREWLQLGGNFFGISQGIHYWSAYTFVFIITKLWRRWQRQQRRKLCWPLPIFTISEDQNLTFSLSPSLLRPLAKNFQKQKSLWGSMWRKSKQQK